MKRFLRGKNAAILADLAPPRLSNNTIYTLFRWIQEMDQEEKSFFIIYDRTLLNSSIYRRDWTSKRQINISSSMNTLVIYRLNGLSRETSIIEVQES